MEIDLVERRIARLPYENAIGYDASGRQIFWIRGSSEAIKVDGELIQELENGTVTHNHVFPGAPALSFGDLEFAKQSKVNRLRAVSFNPYSLTLEIRQIARNGSCWNVESHDEYLFFVTVACQQAHIQYLSSKKYGLLIPLWSPKGVDALDEAMMNMARAWNFTYSRWSNKI